MAAVTSTLKLLKLCRSSSIKLFKPEFTNSSRVCNRNISIFAMDLQRTRFSTVSWETESNKGTPSHIESSLDDVKTDLEDNSPQSFQPKSFTEFDSSLMHSFKVETVGVPMNSKSFADYMNFSKTLQSLVMLGVRLYKIEQRHLDAITYIVNLDLERDIKPRLELLFKNGVLYEEFGDVITKNPTLLDPSIDLEVLRENFKYLADKGFLKDEVTSIVLRCPVVLTIPVAKLDGILGFYQKLPTNREKKIMFSNSELRTLVVRCPGLITGNLYAVYEQIRTLELSCEFTLHQIRRLIKDSPYILIQDARRLELLYKFYIREMKLTNEEILRFPHAFLQRTKYVAERHYYLRHLKKDQYKCDQPCYIPLDKVVEGTDEKFCQVLGLGDVKNFKRFIKTL